MTTHNSEIENKAQASDGLGKVVQPVNLVWSYHSTGISEVVHRAKPDDDGEPICGSGGSWYSGEFIKSTDEQAKFILRAGVNINQVNCKRCLKKIKKESMNV